jgi:hypothetical protein
MKWTERRKVMKEFEVGQKVNVINTGGCHTTYEAFFTENNLLKFKHKYISGDSIERGEHTVVATGWYEGNKNDSFYGKLYLLEDANGQVFIMNNRGNNYLELTTLSTGDMINALMANPYQLFTNGGIIGQDGTCSNTIGIRDGTLIWLCQDRKSKWNNFSVTPRTLKYQWTLVPEPPKPVSIEEAAIASEDGKTIICKYPNFNKPSDECTEECRPAESRLTFHMIRTGKWFVKEE